MAQHPVRWSARSNRSLLYSQNRDQVLIAVAIPKAHVLLGLRQWMRFMSIRAEPLQTAIRDQRSFEPCKIGHRNGVVMKRKENLNQRISVEALTCF